MFVKVVYSFTTLKDSQDYWAIQWLSGDLRLFQHHTSWRKYHQIIHHLHSFAAWQRLVANFSLMVYSRAKAALTVTNVLKHFFIPFFFKDLFSFQLVSCLIRAFNAWFRNWPPHITIFVCVKGHCFLFKQTSKSLDRTAQTAGKQPTTWDTATSSLAVKYKFQPTQEVMTENEFNSFLCSASWIPSAQPSYIPKCLYSAEPAKLCAVED